VRIDPGFHRILASDSRLQRDFAIKVLPTELSTDAGWLKCFEKEARSASALNRPNIATIYDVDSSDSALHRDGTERARGDRFGGDSFRQRSKKGRPSPASPRDPDAELERHPGAHSD
jgi:hypothetical protein